jgi:hypothetical protein
MNTRLTQVLLALVVVLLAAHLLWSIVIVPGAGIQGNIPVEDIVRARLIELVNAEGEVVGQIYTGEDGSGQIRLRSGEGMIRVKLGAGLDGSGLVLMDGDSEPAVWLAVDEQGTRLTLAQKGKTARVLTP